jgi:gamma-glutamyl:cysteine ligase YbdK (ATP-grasp superfamily)
MLDEGLIESATPRIGAEQELFMVDDAWQPAPLISDVMDRVEDSRITTELTRFNLEFNLPPMVFRGDCLSEMEKSLTDLIEDTRQIVQELGGDLILTGILPTIRLADLDLDNMTPLPRYRLLNERLTRLRGGPYEFQIRGIDELLIKHDSVMVEGCNTSFQAHFQVDPEDFAHYYNIAQVATAPVLAAATNSPLLFGKRLWRETRIALFQQAIDTRSSNLYMREMSPRVNFGTDWVRESVLEIFREDISRFQIIMSQADVEDPFECLENGEIPTLEALQIHNGTVYRWNRACYGVHDGSPHLRIENRVLPSGPTAVDEFANAAFWFGLVSAMARKYPSVPEVMDFSDAKGNFMAAARLGLASQFKWMDGKRVPASELICDQLLPLARQGLERAEISGGDIDRYLGIIRERVESGQTGSQWQLNSLHALNNDRTVLERLMSLTAATVRWQYSNDPIHICSLAELIDSAYGARFLCTIE